MQAVLDRMTEVSPNDRTLAERVHATVTTAAPDSAPETWHGKPAYAGADGKVVVYFQDAAKITVRYATLGFNDTATLDDADMWPVSYALTARTPQVQKTVVRLVTAAAG